MNTVFEWSFIILNMGVALATAAILIVGLF